MVCMTLLRVFLEVGGSTVGAEHAGVEAFWPMDLPLRALVAVVEVSCCPTHTVQDGGFRTHHEGD